MAIIDTLFMTKTAEKPYPFEASHTYIAHIMEYPPGSGLMYGCRHKRKYGKIGEVHLLLGAARNIYGHSIVCFTIKSLSSIAC